VTRFKQALLDELISHAQKPTAAPRRRKRAAGLLTAGAVAIAAVAGVLIAPIRDTPAYAVVTNSDGTVTITFRELADSAAATRELRAAGVQAMVVALSVPGSCASLPPGERAAPAPMADQREFARRRVAYGPGSGEPFPMTTSTDPDKMMADGHEMWGKIFADYHATDPSSRTRITIRPEAIPAGAVVLIVQQAFEQDETDDVHLHISLVRDPAPTCLEFTYDGPAVVVK
jgi:hypothetical protein